MRLLPFIIEYPFPERLVFPDVFCERAKDDYPAYRKLGIYQRVAQKSLYVYQIKNHKTWKTHTGILALSDLADYTSGKIKAHEKTMPVREEQQMALMQEWGAMLKPVLLTHSPALKLNSWLDTCVRDRQPAFSIFFETDEQTHALWIVSDPADILILQKLFNEEVKETYIADGHHRAAAMHHFYREKSGAGPNGIFSAYFAADQLYIGDFNRVITLPPDLSETAIPALLSEAFEIMPLNAPQKPQQKYDLTLFFEKKWFHLRWKASLLNAAAVTDNPLLDAQLLNVQVLGDLLGMTDIRTDKRIQYIEGTKGLEGLEKACSAPNRLGFALYPVAFSDLKQLADHGGIMPPKSTFFEPRLKSGLVVLRLE